MSHQKFHSILRKIIRTSLLLILTLVVIRAYNIFRYSEQPGVYVNVPFNNRDSISVAIYDSYRPYTYFMTPGGVDFNRAATDSRFNLRVVAPDSQTAARELKSYLAARGFEGNIYLTMIFDHGRPGRPKLGDQPVGDTLLTLLKELKTTERGADLYLVHCNVAQGVEGKNFIQNMADNYELNVWASEESINWITYFPLPPSQRNYIMNKEDWIKAVPHNAVPIRAVFAD